MQHVKMRREAKEVAGFIFSGDFGSDATVCWPVLDTATQIKNQDVPLGNARGFYYFVYELTAPFQQVAGRYLNVNTIE